MRVCTLNYSLLGIPEAENFAFTFNTLLSDIAVKFPEYRQQIFSSQLTLLNILCNSLQQCMDQNTQLAHNTTSKFLSNYMCLSILNISLYNSLKTILLYGISHLVSLCKTTIPLLLGLCRSLGRFCSTNEWLTGKLFPPNHLNRQTDGGDNSVSTTLEKQGFSNFR